MVRRDIDYRVVYLLRFLFVTPILMYLVMTSTRIYLERILLAGMLCKSCLLAVETKHKIFFIELENFLLMP